jgi:hypothetical protein
VSAGTSYPPPSALAAGMMAGGTGITPMLQVVDHIMRNPADKTQVSPVVGLLWQRAHAQAWLAHEPQLQERFQPSPPPARTHARTAPSFSTPHFP